MARLHGAVAGCWIDARVPRDLTLRFISLFFAIVDDLLEENAAEYEDGNNGPDLQGRL